MTKRRDRNEEPAGPGAGADEPAREVASELFRLLIARLDHNLANALPEVWNPRAELIELAPELVAHIERNRSAILALLSAQMTSVRGGQNGDRDLVEASCSRVEAAVYRHNQFVFFDAEARAGIETVFRRSIVGLRTALLGSEPPDALARALKRVFHAEQLGIAQILRGKIGPMPPAVVCAEYDPELQLRILALSWDTLVDPVLDIGCGSRAALVRAMRAKGRDALGIDREAPGDVGINADWLTFDYGLDRWNTITAHQSFTLHFLHNELRRTSRVIEHARVYLSVLRSLRIGGTFAYAPGLPFIEAHLDSSQYVVRNMSLHEVMGENATLSNLEKATGVQLGTVTQIRRLA